MTDLTPITELVNSVSGKLYSRNRDIAKLDVAQRYQLIRDINRNFKKSPVYLTVMNGILWKLPTELALELFVFAQELYDEGSQLNRDKLK